MFLMKFMNIQIIINNKLSSSVNLSNDTKFLNLYASMKDYI